MSYIFQLKREVKSKDPIKAIELKNLLRTIEETGQTPFKFEYIELGLSNDLQNWCCGFTVVCEKNNVLEIIDWLIDRGFGRPDVFSL